MLTFDHDHHVDDITQLVMIKVLTSKATPRKVHSRWLFMVTRNCILDFRRQLAREHKFVSAEFYMESHHLVREKSHDQMHVDIVDRSVQVEPCIMELSPRLQSLLCILELRHMFKRLWMNVDNAITASGSAHQARLIFNWRAIWLSNSLFFRQVTIAEQSYAEPYEIAMRRWTGLFDPCSRWPSPDTGEIEVGLQKKMKRNVVVSHFC